MTTPSNVPVAGELADDRDPLLTNSFNILLLIEHGCDEAFAKRILDQWEAKCSELAALRTPPEMKAEIVRLIDVLRADEGDSVTILCDNPDFNGQPNCAIVCNGDWTGWVDKRFVADTILDALSMAMVEKNLPSPRKVVATSNGDHWIERFNLVCCRDCGFVRRADDQNTPCKGPVGVGIRRDLAPEMKAAAVHAGAVREALEPFVSAAAGIPKSISDAAPFVRVPNDARVPGTVRTISFGEFRRLIAALKSTTGSAG